ncbi:DNA-directed RNA polymerase III subunit RPC7-like isoform X2 [Haliotis rufescens]|uniref:DNA-directed RNA polymerase III subunit RPC7-like isoform X2 n=1 Tax=Haliotis rufescens TaxID=6454 RepID=UPI00201EC6A1|nr:DNA-directed RNA polymerase III subunit RPC7-like isoform X2 [Haliotis rufescens]
MPVNYKAVPLATGEDYDYMQALKQEFRGASRKSPFFLDLMEKRKDIERYSDKYQLGQQDNCSGWTPDWRRLPGELKIKTKRPHSARSNAKPNLKKAKLKSEVDIDKTLEKLEKIPDAEEGNKEENERQKEEDREEEEAEELYEEEELEEETDYNLNYFDNGEGYGDDDDDVDEGPIY